MITEIATNVDFINEFGVDSIFVVIGKQRALMIDSGSGFCDLKGREVRRGACGVGAE